MGKLDNKVAIITGASQGMGASHAKLFIDEGAKVAITDINDEKGNALAKELGDNAIFIKQDVSSEDDWKKVIDETVQKFGKLDILVNNAGITKDNLMMILFLQFLQGLDGKRDWFAYFRVLVGHNRTIKITSNNHSLPAILVSATKLCFMGSYSDALALRSARTLLAYVPRGEPSKLDGRF